LTQAHLPELQLCPAGQTFVQLPQWLLSLPFTLMHPPAPQSLVPPGQPHVPSEQILPPPQLVPSVFLDQSVVLLVRQIWQAFDGLVAPFP